MEVELGKKYSGVGYSGLTDGVRVIGTLTEYVYERQHATLTNEKGMPMAVNSKTLKIIKENI